jgi:hypothetical protein
MILDIHMSITELPIVKGDGDIDMAYTVAANIEQSGEWIVQAGEDEVDVIRRVLADDGLLSRVVRALRQEREKASLERAHSSIKS